MWINGERNAHQDWPSRRNDSDFDPSFKKAMKSRNVETARRRRRRIGESEVGMYELWYDNNAMQRRDYSKVEKRGSESNANASNWSAEGNGCLGRGYLEIALPCFLALPRQLRCYPPEKPRHAFILQKFIY